MEICIACKKKFSISKKIVCKDNKTGDEYTIAFCECGLGKTITNDLNHKNAIANINMYDDVENRINIYYKRLNHHFQIRHNEILNILTKFVSKNANYLEVGSNIGFTANISRKFGFNVTCCEINEKCRKLSEMIFKLDTHDDFFTVEKKFQVITMIDVLEHFPNPDEAIKKAHDILDEKGILFIQLPNHSSSVSEYYKSNWLYYNPPDHTFHFNMNSIELFLYNNGFKIELIRTVDSIEDFFIFRLVNKYFSDKIIRLIYNNPYYWPGFYLNKKNKGANIQLVAKKQT